MKKPRRTPAKISSRCKARKIVGRNTAMQIPASEKRRARKTNTDERSREFLTTTNVEPHKRVQSARASSARRRWEEAVSIVATLLLGASFGKAALAYRP